MEERQNVHLTYEEFSAIKKSGYDEAVIKEYASNYLKVRSEQITSMNWIYKLSFTVTVDKDGSCGVVRNVARLRVVDNLLNCLEAYLNNGDIKNASIKYAELQTYLGSLAIKDALSDAVHMHYTKKLDIAAERISTFCKTNKVNLLAMDEAIKERLNYQAKVRLEAVVV